MRCSTTGPGGRLVVLGSRCPTALAHLRQQNRGVSPIGCFLGGSPQDLRRELAFPATFRCRFEAAAEARRSQRAPVRAWFPCQRARSQPSPRWACAPKMGHHGQGHAGQSGTGTRIPEAAARPAIPQGSTGRSSTSDGDRQPDPRPPQRRRHVAWCAARRALGAGAVESRLKAAYILDGSSNDLRRSKSGMIYCAFLGGSPKI